MSMPGDVTPEQLSALAGGDSSQSVGGEVESSQDNSANIPAETNNAAQTASTENLFLSADSVYADLPTAFRDAKTLDKVIADVNARHQKALEDAASKYKPYEAFLEIPAENLAYAHQIFQMMDSKDGAEQVFNALAKTYGFQTAVAAVQQMQQEQQIEQEPEELTPEQQEIRALKERIDQMQGFQDNQLQAFNQAVAAENQKRFENDMDAAFNEIYNVDPTLAGDKIRNDKLVATVVEAYDRDLRLNGGRTSIRNLVQQAFNDQRAYNQYLYDKLMSQNQGSRGPAPIVMSPTGSNPGGDHAFNVHDPKQREAEFVARLQALNNS